LVVIPAFASSNVWIASSRAIVYTEREARKKLHPKLIIIIKREEIFE
jgi:hypothetical protein